MVSFVVMGFPSSKAADEARVAKVKHTWADLHAALQGAELEESCQSNSGLVQHAWRSRWTRSSEPCPGTAGTGPLSQAVSATRPHCCARASSQRSWGKGACKSLLASEVELGALEQPSPWQGLAVASSVGSKTKGARTRSAPPRKRRASLA
jgi:hypothetical protein